MHKFFPQTNIHKRVRTNQLKPSACASPSGSNGSNKTLCHLLRPPRTHHGQSPTAHESSYASTCRFVSFQAAQPRLTGHRALFSFSVGNSHSLSVNPLISQSVVSGYEVDKNNYAWEKNRKVFASSENYKHLSIDEYRIRQHQDVGKARRTSRLRPEQSPGSSSSLLSATARALRSTTRTTARQQWILPTRTSDGIRAAATPSSARLSSAGRLPPTRRILSTARSIQG